jgi:antitoxin component HigA of HigAB toxin-antitoxin module
MRRSRVIKTEEDYEAALARAYALMDAAPGSPEEEELDLLARLIEATKNSIFRSTRPTLLSCPSFTTIRSPQRAEIGFPTRDRGP